MGRKLSNVFIFICVAVFIGAGIYVLKYVLENQKAESTMKQVAQERESKGLAELYAQNQDIIGWIEVPGTKINYPVMQTPEDPEYYLHRDFNKNYSESGTPFLDAASCIKDATRIANEEYADESTWDWLVYGHHMKFGTMFHDLLKFEDKEFWKKHKEFTFTHIKVSSDGSIEEIPVDFEIVGAAYGRILPAEDTSFKYYEYAGCYDQDTYDEFVKGVKSASIYDTKEKAEYPRQLIVLSTCSYRFGTNDHNDRFYVVGVKK